jgi:hypothetical protein
MVIFILVKPTLTLSLWPLRFLFLHLRVFIFLISHIDTMLSCDRPLLILQPGKSSAKNGELAGSLEVKGYSASPSAWVK